MSREHYLLIKRSNQGMSRLALRLAPKTRIKPSFLRQGLTCLTSLTCYIVS